MDDLSTQRQMISSQLQPAETLFSCSDTVFLLSRPWLQRWEAYTQSGPHPGPIDNTPLCAFYRKDEGVRTARIRANLSPEEFVYVSPFVWDRLRSWYGGEPEIELFVTFARADWNPILICVGTNIDSQYFRVSLLESRLGTLSLDITLLKLKKYVCRKMQLPEDKYELSLGEKTLDQGLAATLRVAGVKEHDVFSLRERTTFDLQSIEEEENMLDAVRLSAIHGLHSAKSPSSELADFQNGPVIECTKFEQSSLREDCEVVSSRIATVLSLSRTRLSIANIAKTKAKLEVLSRDWKEDVFR